MYSWFYYRTKMVVAMTNTNDLVVVKDNQIINASYRLSLVEQRIVLACIAKIDSVHEITKGDGFTLHVDEIRDLLTAGRTQKSFYEAIKTASNKLYDRSIVLDKDGSKCRWIYEVRYNKNQGSITLFFAPTIIPYLSQLKGKFTKYKLQHVARFKSAASVRLYELLVQWLSKGKREMEVDWLRQTLGLGDKYKNRPSNFISRVVQKACDDINEFSNMKVSFGTRKTGKKITHVQLFFDLKDGNNTKSTELSQAQIKKLARKGETWKEAITRLKKEVR